MRDLPRSEAAERNREPILEALRELARPGESVLEIGAGTGQHAVHCAPALDVTWQPTDRPEQLVAIEAWRARTADDRILPALALDVTGAWPPGPFDGVFSANTAHIMAWDAVLAMFHGVAGVLRPGGWFALYGPFNEGGRFTSPGNERLDAWARSNWAGAGLRDLADVEAAAHGRGLALAETRRLPANNLLLVLEAAGA